MATTLVPAGAVVQSALRRHLNLWIRVLPYRRGDELDVGYTGIDVIEAIKSSIAAGEACSTDEVLVKMTYLAVPYCELTKDALDKKQWFDTMKRALSEIKNTLEQYRWSRFGVSETDDRDFATPVEGKQDGKRR